MQEFREFAHTKIFGSLNGIRCFSIVAVILHHTTRLSFGYMGVDVFFAISGFLITTLLLREKEQWGDISLRLFYMRRSLRIFPVYYTVLLMYVVLVFITQRHTVVGHEFFQHLPFFAFYCSNIFVPLSGRVTFYFAWSLATEEQFYLIWPWIEKTFARFAVPLLLTVVVLRMLVGPFLSNAQISKFPLTLFLGVLCAHLLNKDKSFALLAKITYPKYASTVWLALFLSAAILGVPRAGIGFIIALFVASCVIREDHWLAGILQWKPLELTGQVSYGMYLFHMLVLNVVHKVTNQPFAVFPLTFAVTLGVAYLSYTRYESVFLKMKDRFARVPRTHRAMVGVIQ